MMKIIFCLASLGSGGAERVVSLLANKFAVLGNEVQIICLKYDDVYYRVQDNVKVVLGRQTAPSNLSRLFWLRRYIKNENPDVVIAFTEGVYCFTLMALLGTKVPVIASERLDPSAMAWNRKLLKKLLLPRADWLVVQTQQIKQYFSSSIQRKTSIIFNPVNNQVLSILADNKHPNIVKKKRIISVARLYPQKNQQMMINAFAKIASRYPDWQLVIFGEGPLRAQLEHQIAELGLEGRVLLPGRTGKVVDELLSSELFCLSSDYEGMSNSMIEAICMGLPIVTTRVSGTEELILDGENGFIVNINDADGMSEALVRLMTDDALRISMGEVNKKKAQLFHIDTIVNQWLALIEKVTR